MASENPIKLSSDSEFRQLPYLVMPRLGTSVYSPEDLQIVRFGEFLKTPFLLIMGISKRHGIREVIQWPTMFNRANNYCWRDMFFKRVVRKSASRMLRVSRDEFCTNGRCRPINAIFLARHVLSATSPWSAKLYVVDGGSFVQLRLPVMVKSSSSILVALTISIQYGISEDNLWRY